MGCELEFAVVDFCGVYVDVVVFVDWDEEDVLSVPFVGGECAVDLALVLWRAGGVGAGGEEEGEEEEEGCGCVFHCFCCFIVTCVRLLENVLL